MMGYRRVAGYRRPHFLWARSREYRRQRTQRGRRGRCRSRVHAQQDDRFSWHSDFDKVERRARGVLRWRRCSGRATAQVDDEPCDEDPADRFGHPNRKPATIRMSPEPPGTAQIRWAGARYLSVCRYRWIASTSALLGATPLSVLKLPAPQCGIGDLSGFPSSSMPCTTARSKSSLFHSLASPTSLGPVSPLPFCPWQRAQFSWYRAFPSGGAAMTWAHNHCVVIMINMRFMTNSRLYGSDSSGSCSPCLPIAFFER